MRGAEDEHDQVIALTILSLLRNFFYGYAFSKVPVQCLPKNELFFYFLCELVTGFLRTVGKTITTDDL
jgi:hypothetical protein